MAKDFFQKNKMVIVGVLVAVVLVVTVGLILHAIRRPVPVPVPPTLTVTELIVQEEVLVNARIPVRVTVRNEADRELTEEIEILIGGERVYTLRATVPAGETRPFSRELPGRAEAGSFVVTVRGMTDSFIVRAPDPIVEVLPLVVRNLIVPEEVEEGAMVMVEFDVFNPNPQEVTETIAILLDREEIDSFEFTLRGNETVSEEFLFMAWEVGRFRVEIKDQTAFLVVTAPVVVDPDPLEIMGIVVEDAEVGHEVEAAVVIRNPNDFEVTEELTVYLNEEVIDVFEVTLAAEEIKEMSLIIFDVAEEGDFTVMIKDITESFVVTVPVPVDPVVELLGRPPVALTITVPLAATMVPVLEFDLTAGTEDLVITKMSFRRTGIGRAADFDGFFIFQGGIRLNEHPRLMVEETVAFEELRATVPAGTTQSFVLKANIHTNATPGNESAFKLTSITAGEIEIKGLPITGHTQRIGAIRVGTVELLRGTAVLSQLIGSANVEIANFRISADTPTLIKAILVGIRGTIARGEVTNLVLYHDGVEIATAVTVDGRDRLVFMIDEGLEIAEDATETFSIRADLRGRGRETLLVYLSERADIIAIDQNLGFGSVVDLGGNQRIGEQTLEGGDLVVTANNPRAGNIPRGGDDVVIAGARLLSQRDVEIRDIIVHLAGSIPVAHISDLRIRDANTGATLARKETGLVLGNNTIPGHIFLTGRTIRPINITVDIDDAAPENVDIIATINIGANVRDFEIGQIITDIVNPVIVSTRQVVIVSAARAALLGTPRNITVITGETAVPAIGFDVSALGAEIILREVIATVRANTADTFAAGTAVVPNRVVTRARLMGGATELASSIVRTDGRVNFTGLNLAIPVDTSKALTIQIDVASGLTVRHFVAIEISGINAIDPQRREIVVANMPINVAVATPTRFTTVESVGTLFVDLYPGTPARAIIPAGTIGATGVSMVTARLDAAREAMTVQDVIVGITGAIAAVSTVDLFYAGSVVGTRIIPVGATSVTFTGLTINVPVEGTHNLTARANIFGVGYGSASGNEVRLNLQLNRVVGVHSGISLAVPIPGPTPATPAVPATFIATVPAGVTPPDLALNIDGVPITLVLGDTAAAIGDKIRAAIMAVPTRTVDVTGVGASLIFTNRVVGTVGNRTVDMTDAGYSGGTIPTITMTGGAAALPQIDTGVLGVTAGTDTWTIRIAPLGMAARDFTRTEVTAGDTAATSAAALAALINADIPLPVTASEVGGNLRLVAEVPGPAGGFTSTNLGPGAITFTTTGGTPAAAVAASTTVAVPASVIVFPDLTLNIDGVPITLAPADTAPVIAGKIRTAVNDPLRVPPRTVDVTGAGTDLVFTDRTGVVGTRIVPMIDREYSGGTIPAVTMTGGVAAIAQVDTGTITAAALTFTVRITPAGMIARDFTHVAPAGATTVTIAAALRDAINFAAPTIPVIASVDGANRLVLTAIIPGPAGGFTTTNMGTGVITFATAPAAAPAIAATASTTVPATVATLPDLTLIIDGATITLAHGDTAAGIATRIIGATFARVVATAVAGQPTQVRFTRTLAPIHETLTIAPTDGAYSGGTIPSIVLAGGAAATLAVDAVPITGHLMVVRQTVPTVTVAAGATTLIAGENRLMTVTVAANARGDVILERLGVRITPTNTGGAALTVTDLIIRPVGGAVISDTESDTLSITVDTTADTPATITFTTPETIAAGASRTYEIVAVVTGADTAGESLVSQLTVAGFRWEDVAGGVVDIGGDLISGLPSSIFTLSR